MLRDAHTGLQSLLTGIEARGNVDLPSVDPGTRFALLMLRARLAAEAGLPLDLACDGPNTDPDWAAAHLVVLRWNDSAPLGDDTHALLRASRTHPRPEVSLLAGQLLDLEAVFAGLHHPQRSITRTSQRIAAISLTSGDLHRDTLECAAVAQALVSFFSTNAASDSDQLIALTDRLPGGSRHRVWVTHLLAARTALTNGDVARARMEWVGVHAHLPRFLPQRLTAIIDRLRDVEPDLHAGTQAPGGYTSHLIAYFAGSLDQVSRDAFRSPADLPFGSPGAAVLAALPPGELAELPGRTAFRTHLEAYHEQNPLALTRVADTLAALDYWAPAVHALQEARRIYLRRRASGSVTAVEARLTQLIAQATTQVPWFTATQFTAGRTAKLTPRETAAARLAAHGKSNREIAEELSCSVRTVESHIAQTRAKLGVAKREELADRLNELGLLAPATPQARTAARSTSATRHARGSGPNSR